MSKKKMKRAPRRWRVGVGKRRRYVLVGSVCLIAMLALATVAGPWRTSLSRTRVGSLFFSPPTPPIPPPNSPSKEYIYDGDRLIAAEETNQIVVPRNLVADV